MPFDDALLLLFSLLWVGLTVYLIIKIRSNPYVDEVGGLEIGIAIIGMWALISVIFYLLRTFVD